MKREENDMTVSFEDMKSYCVDCGYDLTDSDITLNVTALNIVSTLIHDKLIARDLIEAYDFLSDVIQEKKPAYAIYVPKQDRLRVQKRVMEKIPQTAGKLTPDEKEMLAFFVYYVTFVVVRDDDGETHSGIVDYTSVENVKRLYNEMKARNPVLFAPERMPGDYEGISGVEFLSAYLLDHGITEEELYRYIHFWYGFEITKDLHADEKGLAYVEGIVKELIEYREKPLDKVLEDWDDNPWSWPSTLSFQRCYRDPPKSNKNVWGIMNCSYNGNEYFFGIGKEEAKITEDMRKNGKWYIYTYSD